MQRFVGGIEVRSRRLFGCDERFCSSGGVFETGGLGDRDEQSEVFVVLGDVGPHGPQLLVVGNELFVGDGDRVACRRECVSAGSELAESFL